MAIPLAVQAAEVRVVAMGLQAQSETEGFRERHAKTGGLERRAEVVKAMFAAADTLDELVKAQGKR